MIHFTLNGEPTQSTPQTVDQLVASHIGDPVGVAVAIDGRVLPRSQWGTQLSEGHVVDILTAVQGG
ncbi:MULTISPECIES: sulfur carrier protein ThiS [Corynebacterium]|uniref:Thiamine biosynthesis protein ThiS n=1 Tax=Corynebacterium flavescens TaxID=28028 RepID=A0A1L7CJ11_CORFL|nr:MULTISPECIES: sulfur carrier protein ThiS [Corynebacterium]APT85798.1 thiamine biosynthesis protein ThiS [Corynebacterium flavescens]KAA8725288.1 sulfur carrier protein ThiS [Corynebacterium flavescens]MDN6098826.1 sulfur carrier protein ThiS [Corynebacterium flavescens]MDN6199055.1 sulfur carrier protein ThiS [Corynebacterium flavescens]MDN6226966.1 sulfur carrier protein ThiS [Corynebacterium flavescens]